ncbi:MAG: hypothetical protein E6K13_03990, partial [Methanobacteriota archaeon]
MRVRTGVEGFDPIVGGGVPEGASVVVQGPAGSEKETFGLQFLAEGLRSGEAVVIVISSTSPEQYLESLSRLRVPVKEAIEGNRLKVVDWHSYQEENVTGVEERGHVYRCSVDLTNVGIAISRALGKLAVGVPRRAVLEILSPGLQVFEVGQVYAFAKSTKAKLSRHKVTALFLLEKEMHDAATVSSVSQPFDGVIDIDRHREGDAIVRKIAVLSMKDTAPDEKFHEFVMITGQGMVIGRAGKVTVPEPAPEEPAKPPTRGRVVRAAPSASAPDAATPSSRAAMILRIAEERIRVDPKDADALFAKASALASMGDEQGAVKVLNALAEVNDMYPGLWVLRTKLFSRLGDADGAKANRKKAEEVAQREERKARGDMVACPLCEGLAPVDALECPHCGAGFIEEVGLADELDSLGKAAIQDRVGEELSVEPETGNRVERKVAAKPVDRVGEPKVPVSTEPAGRRGMTNGLARQSPRGGMGRTNGLTNGLGGRTNGVGRTNGLQGGGQTNGLTNGLASLRRGMTNGLTNGNGFTNGLGAGRFQREAAVTKWKLYVIPLLSVVLLMLPLLGPSGTLTGRYPIRIDGDPADWNPAAIAAEVRSVGPNPDVDIVRFGIT